MKEECKIFSGFDTDVERALNEWLGENSEKIRITERGWQHSILPDPNEIFHSVITVVIYFVRK